MRLSAINSYETFEKYVEKLYLSDEAEYVGLDTYYIEFPLEEKREFEKFFQLADRYSDVDQVFINNGFAVEVKLLRHIDWDEDNW